jgi:hypothetical protein
MSLHIYWAELESTNIIEFRAETTATGAGGTTPSVSVTSGLSDGDVVYIALVQTGGTVASSGPSGFTQIISDTTFSNPRISVWRKVITDAAGEGTDWTFPASLAVAWGLRAIAVSGADTTTPEDVTPVVATYASGNPRVASITPVTAGNVLWSLVAANTSSQTISQQSAPWINGAEIGERKNQAAWTTASGTTEKTISWEWSGSPTNIYLTMIAIRPGTEIVAGPVIVRPITDVLTTGWTNEVGATTNLYASLDEVSANDTDFAQYTDPNGTEPLILSLETASNPVINTGHKLRYRIGSSDAVDWTVRLLQDTTEIASWPHTDITAPQTFEQTLTEGEAGSITNYAALRVEFDPSV